MTKSQEPGWTLIATVSKWILLGGGVGKFYFPLSLVLLRMSSPRLQLSHTPDLATCPSQWLQQIPCCASLAGTHISGTIAGAPYGFDATKDPDLATGVPVREMTEIRMK
jgi:hypothetical protein